MNPALRSPNDAKISPKVAVRSKTLSVNLITTAQGNRERPLSYSQLVLLRPFLQSSTLSQLLSSRMSPLMNLIQLISLEYLLTGSHLLTVSFTFVPLSFLCVYVLSPNWTVSVSVSCPNVPVHAVSIQ